jgi:hypothetical protein
VVLLDRALEALRGISRLCVDADRWLNDAPVSRPADIAWLGRERALPRGFGSRVIMLDNLLHSAVDYGLLGALLMDLRALLDTRDQALADLGAELALEASVGPWRQALARTRTLVSTLDAASR